MPQKLCTYGTGGAAKKFKLRYVQSENVETENIKTENVKTENVKTEKQKNT